MHEHPTATEMELWAVMRLFFFVVSLSKCWMLASFKYKTSLLIRTWSFSYVICFSRIRTQKWLELHWNPCTDYCGFTWSELNVKATQLPKGKVYLFVMKIHCRVDVASEEVSYSPEFLQITYFCCKIRNSAVPNKTSPLVALSITEWKLLYKVFLLLEKLEVTPCSV